MGKTLGVKYSRLIDGCCYRYPVVKRSEVDVRCGESESFGKANLIIHHGIANIIHQIVEPRVLSVVQELRDILLGRHWVQNLTDSF